VPNGICGVQVRCEIAEDSNILRCYVVPIGTHLPKFRWHCDALKRPELPTKRHGFMFHKLFFYVQTTIRLTFVQERPRAAVSVCRSVCLFDVRHSAAGRRKSDRPKRVAAINRLRCVPTS